MLEIRAAHRGAVGGEEGEVPGVRLHLGDLWRGGGGWVGVEWVEWFGYVLVLGA